MDTEGHTSINTLYFAGGGARVKVWSFKMNVLGAYVKLAGQFAPQECPDGDAGSLTVQANMKMLLISFGIDYEGNMCEGTEDPCKVQFMKEDNMEEKLLGTMSVFHFEKTIFGSRPGSHGAPGCYPRTTLWFDSGSRR